MVWRHKSAEEGNSMNRQIERGLMILVAILLPVVLMLSSLEVTAFDEGFYADMHDELNITEVVGTDSGELAGISSKIIDYLRNKTDSLDMKAEIGGESIEVFGDREKAHMADVKKLFMGGFYLRNVFLSFVILALYLLYFMSGKKIEKPGKAVLSSGFTMAVISILFIFMMLTDFQRYFIIFHEIFFTNDLWLLNPKTDVLIQMLPIEFFYEITEKTVKIFIAMYASIMVLAYLAVSKLEAFKK